MCSERDHINQPQRRELPMGLPPPPHWSAPRRHVSTAIHGHLALKSREERSCVFSHVAVEKRDAIANDVARIDASFF